MTGTTAELIARCADRAASLRTIGELMPSVDDEAILMRAACERRGCSVVAVREEKERVLSRSARRSDYVGGTQ